MKVLKDYGNFREIMRSKLDILVLECAHARRNKCPIESPCNGHRKLRRVLGTELESLCARRDRLRIDTIGYTDTRLFMDVNEALDPSVVRGWPYHMVLDGKISHFIGILVSVSDFNS